MNFYDVLAAEKWDGGIPTTNFFDLLFARFISGEQWEIYEGTLPATFNANGDDMRQYQIYGNTGGVGDRTVNLFDENAAYENGFYANDGTFVGSGGVATYGYFSVEALTEYFYKAFNASQSSAESDRTIRVNFFDSQKNFISRYLDIGTALSIKNITTPQNCAFVRLSVNKILSNIVFSTTPPASYVPFGYEVDMVSKTANIVPKFTSQSQGNLTLTAQNDGTVKINGSDNSNAFFYTTLSLSEGVYSMNNFISIEHAGSSTLRVDIRRGSKDGAIIASGSAVDNGSEKTFSVSAADAGQLYYVIRVAANYQADNVIVRPCMVNGNTIPTKYQPYSNTTTPIYIGDDPLEKDEYVDSQEEKIYRLVAGVLTPTDPPVPLPALPTCDGTTIVDYAGESVVPEKVVLEYKKGGN